eukprot:365182-Chlamydomonas_euryale.AAC.8
MNKATKCIALELTRQWPSAPALDKICLIKACRKELVKVALVAHFLSDSDTFLGEGGEKPLSTSSESESESQGGLAKGVKHV